MIRMSDLQDRINRLVAENEDLRRRLRLHKDNEARAAREAAQHREMRRKRIRTSIVTVGVILAVIALLMWTVRTIEAESHTEEPVWKYQGRNNSLWTRPADDANTAGYHMMLARCGSIV